MKEALSIRTCGEAGIAAQPKETINDEGSRASSKAAACLL